MTPSRIVGADAARLTAKARTEIETVETISSVVAAAGRLAASTVPYVHGNLETPAYEISRFVTFADFALYEKWRKGVHFRDETPLDGSTLLSWSAKVGAVPSIARSHAQREARWTELDAAYRRSKGERPAQPRVSGRSRTLERGPTDRDAMHVDLY